MYTLFHLLGYFGERLTLLRQIVANDTTTEQLRRYFKVFSVLYNGILNYTTNEVTYVKHVLSKSYHNPLLRILTCVNATLLVGNALSL